MAQRVYPQRLSIVLKSFHWYDYVMFLSAILIAACVVYVVRP